MTVDLPSQVLNGEGPGGGGWIVRVGVVVRGSVKRPLTVRGWSAVAEGAAVGDEAGDVRARVAGVAAAGIGHDHGDDSHAGHNEQDPGGGSGLRPCGGREQRLERAAESAPHAVVDAPVLSGFLARIDAELGDDFADMPLRAVHRDPELFGDLGVGAAGDEQGEHFALARRPLRFTVEALRARARGLGHATQHSEGLGC